MTTNENPERDRRPQPVVVPVTSVLQGRPAIPATARVLMAMVLVGVIAFVAGAQLSGRHPSSSPDAQASSPVGSVAASITATASPPTTAAAAANGLPTASSFAAGFRPLAVIAGLPGGAGCVSDLGGDPGTTTAASRDTLVRTWLTACPLAPNRRPAFLNELLTGLDRVIPNSVSNLTRGYKGMTLVYYLYTTGRFTGTVVLTAKPIGGSVQITITLEDGPA